MFVKEENHDCLSILARTGSSLETSFQCFDIFKLAFMLFIHVTLAAS